MNQHGLSRRDWGRALMAAVPLNLGAASEECVLQNHAIRCVIVVDRGHVRSRRLTHRPANETVELSSEMFALEFEGGSRIRSSDLKAMLTTRTGTDLEFLFSGVDGAAEVRLRYQLPAGKSYLRKQLSVRLTGGPPLRLLRADLDNWQGVRRNWRSMTADRLR